MRKKTDTGSYIYTPDAVFRGDVLEKKATDISERRKSLREAGAKNKAQLAEAGKRKTRRRLLALFVFLVLCGTIWALGKSLLNMSALNAELDRKKAELEALEREIEKGRDTLEQVNSDEYIEQKARSELRMIKEGEILYIVEKDPEKPADKPEHAPEGGGEEELD